MINEKIVKPFIWEVETANNTKLNFSMNRDVVADEVAPEPTYLELLVKQQQPISKKIVSIVDGKETITEDIDIVEVAIPIKINCAEAQIMAQTILYKCLPNYKNWYHLPKE